MDVAATSSGSDEKAEDGTNNAPTPPLPREDSPDAGAAAAYDNDAQATRGANGWTLCQARRASSVGCAGSLSGALSLTRDAETHAPPS
jgi:hypothetical protein